MLQIFMSDLVLESTHDELIQEGVDLLKEMGFTETEIHTEFTCDSLLNKEKKYRVDIVAFNKEKRIAIECGHIDALKLAQLQSEFGFDEVIHIPFHKIFRFELLIKRMERLEKENKRLRNEIDYLKKNLDIYYYRWKFLKTNKRYTELHDLVNKLEKVLANFKDKLFLPDLIDEIENSERK